MERKLFGPQLIAQRLVKLSVRTTLCATSRAFLTLWGALYHFHSHNFTGTHNLTRAHTHKDVGEDGHAFVLSPEGLQVFLDEAASQQSLSAPGQTMETHTGGSEGGEDTVVRAVVEREGKPASKVRFAEPPTEDGEEDTVSREEGVGGEAGKGNPF